MHIQLSAPMLIGLGIALVFMMRGSRDARMSRKNRRMYRSVMRMASHGPEKTQRQAKTREQRRVHSRIWFTLAVALSVFAFIGGSYWKLLTVAEWGFKAFIVLMLGWWLWWVVTRHRERIVLPLYLALIKYTGWDENDRPQRWLKIPRRAARLGPPEWIQWLLTVGENSKYLPMWVKRFRTSIAPAVSFVFPVGGADVKLKFPKQWEGSSDQVSKIGELVSRRLPADWEASYDYRKFRATYSVKKPMPTRVNFEMGANPQPHKIPLGMVSADHWFHSDEEGVAPHGMVSASTGYGKTTVLMIPAAWTLNFGGEVLWCDVKRSRSLMQIKGTPNLRIFMDVENIADAIHEFYVSMRAYYDAQENGEDITDETQFPSKMLVLDELPSTREMLRIWWKEKNKGKRGAGECPAFSELSMILTQGREANHRVWTGVQQANKDVLRTSLERDQYACRIAAGPQSAESWRMMFGGKKESVALVKGRAILGYGPIRHTIQLAYITEKQFRAMGEHGAQLRREREAARTDVSPTDVPGQSTHADHAAETISPVPGQDTPIPGPRLRLVKDETPSDQDEQEGTGTTPDDQGQDEPELITGIRAGAEYLGMTQAAFERARKRSIADGEGIPGETRQGRSPAWPPHALREWHAQRPIAGARELPPTASD